MANLDLRLARGNGLVLTLLLDIDNILIAEWTPSTVPAIRAALRAAAARGWAGWLEIEACKLDRRICRYIEARGWMGWLNAPLCREVRDLARVRTQRAIPGAGAPETTSQPTATARG